MRSLETKIPPPILALLTGCLMWGIASATPSFALSEIIHSAVATFLALGGIACVLSGFLAFGRAHTTINPVKPEAASALVCGGIYRYTRNPMYLGLLLVLTSWAIFLSSAWALLGPVAFKFYIERFQILPEERVLAAKFGAAFAEYQSRVRRWL
ncbi:MAG: isoprenylcysteine carboxylmethyltransferase family protein [Burkholderiaceae bacterium]|nr:isoprenylcysteine carboxylmethyltransferase family protein [Burkholderiaceae bacterium]